MDITADGACCERAQHAHAPEARKKGTLGPDTEDYRRRCCRERAQHAHAPEAREEGHAGPGRHGGVPPTALLWGACTARSRAGGEGGRDGGLIAAEGWVGVHSTRVRRRWQDGGKQGRPSCLRLATDRACVTLTHRQSMRDDKEGDRGAHEDEVGFDEGLFEQPSEAGGESGRGGDDGHFWWLCWFLATTWLLRRGETHFWLKL